jgi:hypothetical protein
MMTLAMALLVSRAQRSSPAVRCRPGTPVFQSKLGPGSAVHHFAVLVLHRVLDTTSEAHR